MALLQWNLNGFFAHLPELQLIISQTKFYYLCLQETRFRPNQSVNLKSYTNYRKDRENSNNASGGVAILVHDSIQAQQLDLKTELEAVAISTYIPNLSKVTICNIYLPPNKTFTSNQLDSLIQQLPSPIILVGDMNSSSTLWGSHQTDSRGRKIEKILDDNKILLNGYEPTHFCTRTGNFSTIDLSICDAILAPSVTWEVLPKLWSDGHLPVQISFPKVISQKENIKKWNIKKANWALFRELSKIEKPHIPNNKNIDEIVLELITLLNTAAIEAIGYKNTPSTRKSVPWWNEACKKTTTELKKALTLYKKTRSLDNLINLKKCRARVRRTIQESKKKSWENYTSSINLNTPPSQVWEKIKNIKGHRTAHEISTIFKNNKTITSPQEIADTLAETFHSNSSDNNYNDTFTLYKKQQEKEELKIEDLDDDINKPFTMPELISAINNQKLKKCPGPDGITSEIIKQLPPETIDFLLILYNHIWLNKTYPKQWREVTVYPVLKPNKPKTNTENYRPISASNNFSKILQKMVNQRLVWYLETNKILNNNQAGFRKGRSTIDNVLQLTTEVKKTFKKRHNLIALFFDLKKAYDTAWRKYILTTLQEHGLDGHILYYVKNFLQEREYKVRANGHLSKKMTQENGVPQGEILSVTLFLMAINKITKNISPTVKTCLFADDLLIFTSGPNLRSIRNQLQLAINHLEEWCKKTGFQFSPSKTKALHFNKKQYNNYNPHLQLNNHPIEYVQHIKFLGIIFDTKLTWKNHITSLKKDCMQRLNLLKTLAHHKWGANREVLIRIYYALIRSKLDYGSIAFCTAKRSYLNILEPIQNTAIRIATGAFRTSPIKSILCEADQIPLEYRRTKLTLTYLANLAEYPNNPTFNYILERKDGKITLLEDTYLHDFINAEMNFSLPSTENQIQNTVPPWSLLPPRFNLNLNKYPKNTTHPNIFKQMYHENLATYTQYNNIFTDGSKVNQQTGAAVVYDTELHKFRLPDMASVFTAEAYAILKATELVNSDTIQRNHLIQTDSLSTIMSIQQLYPENKIINQIQNNIHQATLNGKKIVIMWVPSHIGIPGNEKADRTAREAINITEYTATNIQTQDIKNYLKDKVNTKWKTHWNSVTQCHLKRIKEESEYWTPLDNRKEQVVLTRLRIGHTLLTHKHIFERGEPTKCDTCNTNITVEHILLECPKYEAERNTNKIPPSLKEALSNNEETTTRLINYLKETMLFNKI